MNVADIRPADKKIDVRVIVLQLNAVREIQNTADDRVHRVAEALVADETGCIWLSLWDNAADLVETGGAYEIRNAYASFYRSALRLNVGRYGTIAKSDVEIRRPNAHNNLSEKEFPV